MTYQTPALTGSQKPGKVQAVAILTLVSGITNILWMLFLGVFVFSGIAIATLGIGCLLYPLLILPIVLGVFEIIYSAKLLPTPIKPVNPSQAIAILEICCILTGNILPVAAGIVALVMYSDPAVKAYFAKINNQPAPVPPTPAPKPVQPAVQVPPAAPKLEQLKPAAGPIVPPSPAPAQTVSAVKPVVPATPKPEQPKPVEKAAKPKAAPVKGTKPAPKSKTTKPAAKPAAPKAKKPGS